MWNDAGNELGWVLTYSRSGTNPPKIGKLLLRAVKILTAFDRRDEILPEDSGSKRNSFR